MTFYLLQCKHCGREVRRHQKIKPVCFRCAKQKKLMKYEKYYKGTPMVSKDGPKVKKFPRYMYPEPNVCICVAFCPGGVPCADYGCPVHAYKLKE